MASGTGETTIAVTKVTAVRFRALCRSGGFRQWELMEHLVRECTTADLLRFRQRQARGLPNLAAHWPQKTRRKRSTADTTAQTESAGNGD